MRERTFAPARILWPLDAMGWELSAVEFDWPARDFTVGHAWFAAGIFNENAYIPGRYLP